MTLSARLPPRFSLYCAFAFLANFPIIHILCPDPWSQLFWTLLAVPAGAWLARSHFLNVQSSKPGPRTAGPLSKRREPALEGLRGLVMSIVFLEHFASVFRHYLDGQPGWQGFFLAIPHWTPGSSTFLMLSAYFTYGTFLRNPSRGHLRYLADRVRRLAPSYWVVLAAYLPLVLLAGDTQKIPAPALSASAVVLANFFMAAPLFNLPSIVTATWTISFVLLGYCLVPLVAKAGTLWRRTSLQRVPLILLFGLVAWAVSRIGLFGFTGYQAITAGMLLCEFRQWPQFQRFVESLPEAAVIGFLAASIYLVQLIRGFSFWPELVRQAGYWIYVFALLLFVAYRFVRMGILNRVLCQPFFGRLGDRSYAYYLTHGMVIVPLSAFLKILLPPERNGAWVFAWALPIAYTLTVVFARLFHSYVELPLRADRNRRPEPATATLGADNFSAQPAVPQ
jgi:peptidoglycan/LPS O-acetylase OafA/YrhL